MIPEIYEYLLTIHIAVTETLNRAPNIHDSIAENAVHISRVFNYCSADIKIMF